MIIGTRILLFVLFTLGFGIKFHLPGVTVSFVLALLVSALISVYLAFRRIRVSPHRLLSHLWTPILGVLLAAIPYLLFSLIPVPGVPAWLIFVGHPFSLFAVQGLILYPHYWDSLHTLCSVIKDFVIRLGTTSDP